MSPVKKEKPAVSAFERKRLENIASTQAILKDLSTSAQKAIPKPAPKPKTTAPRKRTTPVKKEPSRPTRTSSRLAGIGADSETLKRKADVEEEFAKDAAKAKRQRIAGDIHLSDVVAGGEKWNKGNDFLPGVMRGAVPNQRTFTENDIKETTDENLKSLMQKMSGLELYDGFQPNQIQITPERVYSMRFHPTEDKPLIFAGDKVGNVGIFDASQAADHDDEDDADAQNPAITAYSIHSKTVTSLVFPADGNSLYSSSYDSSIRKLDLQKGVAVEAYAPESLHIDLAISSISIPPTDPNLLFFSTLEGSLGRHDMRTPKDTEHWQLSEKKIGGFSLHPLYSYLAATASLDRTLKIWDLRKITGKGKSRVPHLVGEHESRLSVSHASFSAGGHVATSSYDDTIKIYSFTDAGSWKSGHSIDSEAMVPSASIQHNNQSGRWVTILKPHWQERPSDGIQKFVIGNMNRFVDVYASGGEQLAQLGGEGISAVPAVAQFHPSQDWVAGGTARGKLCLWM